MLTHTKETGARPAALFGGGLLAGVVLAALFAVAFGRAVLAQGVTVHLDTAPIAAQVQAEVWEMVRRELPATLDAMKRELPGRVAAQTAQRLSETRVDLGGFQIPVPPAAAEQVKKGVEQALRAGMDLAVTQAEVNALSDRFSRSAGAMVRQKLNHYLAGQTFHVEVLGGITVPVHVVLD